MPTYIKMTCGGCDAETQTEAIRKTFVGLNATSYGFGSYQMPDIDKAVEPTCWVWSDCIGCTYCPQCWAEIEKDAAA